MSGISVKLPLSLDEQDGAYALNKTILDNTKQNLRMLLLTSPGERIMDPSFGVGIRSYLFENLHETTYIDIENKIYQQVEKYMPFIQINNLEINSQNQFGTEPNSIFISIQYKILPISAYDILQENISLKTQ